MSSTDALTSREGAVGLTAQEAASRLAQLGPNVLPTPRRTPAWRRLVAELVHFFALLFWVAGALALLAGMPQLGLAIFVVVVLNGAFAFVQEERAEHAAERLRDLLPHRATVVRGGEQTEIDAADLVDGDRVVLAEGDRISADLIVVSAHGLAIDQSTLTGESVPVRLEPGSVVYAGSFVTEGEAICTVVATGSRTRLAEIARLSHRQRPAPSPLRLELARISRIIAVLSVVVGTAFFGLSLLLGMAPTDGFIFGVGVTVALVPCGLLPTVTLSLAVGAQRMAARRALVRHLEAVETVGATTFICTDKTGTLTRNEMVVVEVWTPGGTATITGSGYGPDAEVHLASLSSDDLRALALTSARCAKGDAVQRDGRWVARGDPQEAAIVAMARRVGADIDGDRASRTQRAVFPFDPRRRRMSVHVGQQLVVKGAPDALLPLCHGTEGAADAVDRLTERGLRVLAVATRSVSGELPPDPVAAERDLDLIGLLALEDPPRPQVASAITSCREAGIRVAVITGDHPGTARAIATEVGIIRENGLVLEASDLPADEAELAELIDRDGVVLARVSPEDKLRIAVALRRQGHVVAMTGDGVNDAPALHEAAVGIAMGASGTDVAREAADLVLLDDDFSTIVAAIEQGRSTYSNIRRFLTYHLTDNVAELTPFVVWALSGGRVPLALGVLQILALDIGTDVLPALALGAEAPSTHVLRAGPARAHLLDRRVLGRAFGLLGPVEALAAMAAFLVTFVASGWSPGDEMPGGTTLAVASGAAFTTVVMAQAANAFACRSTSRPVWRTDVLGNRLLLGAVAAELGLLVLLLFCAPVADLLGHRSPGVVGCTVALLAMPALLAADGIQKWVVRRGRAPVRSKGFRRAEPDDAGTLRSSLPPTPGATSALPLRSPGELPRPRRGSRRST